MTSPERWQRAQNAESNHQSHTSTPDDLQWTKDWLNERFGLLIDFLHEKDILEIGCGTGMIHNFDFTERCVGIDPLLWEFSGKVEDSSASLVNGAAEQLPFPGHAFDIVICYNVIDHVLNPIDLLNEAYRVLKDEGDFFLTVNTFETNTIMRRLADYVDQPHPHHFTIEEVQNLVKDSNFDITKDDIREIDPGNLKGNIALWFFGLQQYHLWGEKS